MNPILQYTSERWDLFLEGWAFRLSFPRTDFGLDFKRQTTQTAYQCRQERTIGLNSTLSPNCCLTYLAISPQKSSTHCPSLCRTTTKWIFGHSPPWLPLNIPEIFNHLQSITSNCVLGLKYEEQHHAPPSSGGCPVFRYLNSILLPLCLSPQCRVLITVICFDSLQSLDTDRTNASCACILLRHLVLISLF